MELSCYVWYPAAPVLCSTVLHWLLHATWMIIKGRRLPLPVLHHVASSNTTRWEWWRRTPRPSRKLMIGDKWSLPWRETAARRGVGGFTPWSAGLSGETFSPSSLDYSHPTAPSLISWISHINISLLKHLDITFVMQGLIAQMSYFSFRAPPAVKITCDVDTGFA